MLARAPRGTRDILPGEVEKWQYIERVFKKICQNYDYKEIRTPIFEHTELFTRSVGEETDIVGKEMYTFLDKGERSITLRPEGTASTVRAFLEHKLYTQAQPTKFFYLGPMFRYDRPQAGRYRQFHQFGVEAFGAENPSLDAEVIMLAMVFFHSLQLDDLLLELNSVGCESCRPLYKEEIQKHLSKHKDDLCPDCQKRSQTNPLRILDCKENKCKDITREVPGMYEHLCSKCDQHFSGVIRHLRCLDIAYELNPRLVRGLDYYTKTAFEIVDPLWGSQNSLGGGGRYDNLVEVCGGNPTPAIGFAVGLERILLALESKNYDLKDMEKEKIFVATLGEKAGLEGTKLVMKLRENDLRADKDYLDRSLKAQMKQANKTGSRFVIILGDEEIEKNKTVLRDMQTGDQKEVSLQEIVKIVKKIIN